MIIHIYTQSVIVDLVKINTTCNLCGYLCFMLIFHFTAIWLFICNVTVVVYSLKNTEPIEVETTKENTTDSNQSHVSANDDTEATEFEGELFEGDLDISIETIQQFYEIDEMQEEEIMSTLGSNNGSRYVHALGKRAAASDRHIWSGGIVPFTYNSSLSAKVRNRIRKAMDEYENTTCLHFIEHTNQRDYIHFTDASALQTQLEEGEADW